MKTNIDLTKDFTMQDIASREFVFFVRDEIKKIEEDQKIAKRDRKFAKHPCESERKYDTESAYYRVMYQRKTLCKLYEVYYFMKKNKDYDWSTIKFEYVKDGWRKGRLDVTELYPNKMEEEGYKVLKNYDYIGFDILFDFIKKYVEENGK